MNRNRKQNHHEGSARFVSERKIIDSESKVRECGQVLDLMQLRAQAPRSSLASCSQESSQVVVIVSQQQVRRSSSNGFTAIDVEPDDSSPQAKSVLVRCALNSDQGSNDGDDREQNNGCRRRRPAAISHHHPPRNPSQKQNAKSSCLRDCLLCKCCNKGDQ